MRTCTNNDHPVRRVPPVKKEDMSMNDDENKKADEIRFFNRLSFHTSRLSQDSWALDDAIRAADRVLIVATAKTLQHDVDAGLREIRGMKVSSLSKITQTDFVCSLELTREGAKHLLEATQAEKRGQMDKCNKHIAQWTENVNKATEINAGITKHLHAYQASLPAPPEVKAS
jgi:hypothetical protein